MSSDLQNIISLLERQVAAVNDRDLERYARTLAADAVYMPPNAPRVSGRSAVLTYVRKTFFDSKIARLRAEFAQIELLGSLAFAHGSFWLTLNPSAQRPAIEATGKLMSTFRKEPDGHWKYARAIWNFDCSVA